MERDNMGQTGRDAIEPAGATHDGTGQGQNGDRTGG